MSDNNLATKQDLSTFYNSILPYLGGGMKLAGPVGMIISYMGNTAPSGYLACDGSWYNIGDYPKLANWMMDEFGSYSYFALSGETVQSGKFKVPDLRGEFLRGTGTNSHANQGSGASVGVHQDATEHPFITGNALGVYVRHLVDGTSAFLNTDSNVYPSTKCFVATGDDRDDTGTRYANITSRPTNTSVLYCIKYEGDGAGEVYSTDERVIGKWIDGKPLYQKTIDCGSGPNATRKSVAHGISNLDRIISFDGILTWDGTRQSNPVPMLHLTEPQNGINAWADETNVTLDSSSNRSSAYIYVTLQYTKTT